MTPLLRTLPLALGCLLLPPVAKAAPPHAHLAYEEGGKLFIARLDGTGAKTVGSGRYPRLSPDGRFLASNTDSQRTTDRFIQVTSVKDGKSTLLKKLPSSNSFAPVWSPDGEKLAFQTLPGSDWQIGVCSRDGSGFFLLKTPPGISSLWNPVWAKDGASIYCHDLERIYRIGLDGKVLGEWELKELLPDTYLDSSRSLSLSEDGVLLLSLGLYDTPSVVGPEPGSAIWEITLETKAAKRLTDPESMDAFDGQWLPKREDGFFFSAMTEEHRVPAIYRWQPGQAPQRIINKGNSPSTAP